MNWKHYFDGMATRPFLMLGFAALGVVLIAVTTWRLSRMKKTGGSPARVIGGLFFLLFGLTTGGIAAFVLISRPHTLGQLFRDDFADAAGMELLKKSSLALETTALPGEWPQWRGPRRDGISSEPRLLDTWPEKGPPVVWRKPIKGGYSSLAVVNGRVYTMDRDGDQERVLCFDAATGQELWVHLYDATYGHIAYGSGPRATPTVCDNRLYTVGATGVFLCLDIASAAEPKLLWEHKLLTQFDAALPQWGVASSPLIEGDLVIVQPGGEKGCIAAFDRVSGKLAWTALSENAGYSSPVAVTCAGVRQIIAMTGHGVTGLRPADGKQLWYYDWPTQFDANIATPIVAGNYVFISSNYGAGCALLELTSDGTGGVQVKPTYVRTNKLMRNHHSSCVLHDGHLYGFDMEFLKCVDLRTAEEKWNAAREVKKGSLIVADGKLIILTEKGQLVLADASSKAFQKKGEFQLFEGGDVWALPALANGRLYVRDANELVCLDLRTAN